MKPVPLSTTKAMPPIRSVCCHPLRCHRMYRGRPDQTPRSLVVEIHAISQLSTPILMHLIIHPEANKTMLYCYWMYRSYRLPDWTLRL